MRAQHGAWLFFSPSPARHPTSPHTSPLPFPFQGDGAGILVGMPHEFLRQRVATELGVHDLPEHGRYAAGNFFFPQDPAGIAESKGIVNRLVEQYGMTVIG